MQHPIEQKGSHNQKEESAVFYMLDFDGTCADTTEQYNQLLIEQLKKRGVKKVIISTIMAGTNTTPFSLVMRLPFIKYLEEKAGIEVSRVFTPVDLLLRETAMIEGEFEPGHAYQNFIRPLEASALQVRAIAETSHEDEQAVRALLALFEERRVCNGFAYLRAVLKHCGIQENLPLNEPIEWIGGVMTITQLLKSQINEFFNNKLLLETFQKEFYVDFQDGVSLDYETVCQGLWAEIKSAEDNSLCLSDLYKRHWASQEKALERFQACKPLSSEEISIINQHRAAMISYRNMHFYALIQRDKLDEKLGEKYDPKKEAKGKLYHWGIKSLPEGSVVCFLDDAISELQNMKRAWEARGSMGHDLVVMLPPDPKDPKTSFNIPNNLNYNFSSDKLDEIHFRVAAINHMKGFPLDTTRLTECISFFYQAGNAIRDTNPIGAKFYFEIAFLLLASAEQHQLLISPKPVDNQLLFDLMNQPFNCYLRTPDQLYYLHKTSQAIKVLELPAETLSKFDNSLKIVLTESMTVRNLMQPELDIIRSLKIHQPSTDPSAHAFNEKIIDSWMKIEKLELAQKIETPMNNSIIELNTALHFFQQHLHDATKVDAAFQKLKLKLYMHQVVHKDHYKSFVFFQAKEVDPYFEKSILNMVRRMSRYNSDRCDSLVFLSYLETVIKSPIYRTAITALAKEINDTHSPAASMETEKEAELKLQ